MSKKRMLVAGGAGVLGSQLCERLIAAVIEALCVGKHDNGYRRHDVSLPLDVEPNEILERACPVTPVRRRIARFRQKLASAA